MHPFLVKLASFAGAFALAAPMAGQAATFSSVSKGQIPNLYNSRAAWADVNQDGFLDVAISGIVSQTSNTRRTAVFVYNNGSYVRASNQDLSAHGEGTLAWADVDNNSWPDLLVTGGRATGSPETIIYESYGAVGGDPGFTPYNASTTGLAATVGGGYFGDFNRDGLADVLLVGGETATSRAARVYLNQGGTFQFTPVASPGLTAVGEEPAAAIGDLNQDGYLDIVILGRESSTSSILRVFRGNGNGTFTTARSLTPGLWDGQLALGDYDGNGRLDIAAIGKNQAGTSQALLFRNDGSFNFTNITTSGLAAAYTTSLQFGDFTNDGKPDLVLAGFSTQSNSRVARLYTNRGASANPVFQEIDAGTLPLADRGFAALGDYDNDGKLDLLAGGKTAHAGNGLHPGQTTLFRNIGAAKNAPAIPANLLAYSFATSENPSSVKFAWNAASASPTPQSSLSYNLGVDDITNARIRIIDPLSISTGRRRVAEPGNAGNLTSLLLARPFTKNDLLLTGVQSVDVNQRSSGFNYKSWRIFGNQAMTIEAFTGTVDLSLPENGNLDWAHWGSVADGGVFDKKGVASPYFTRLQLGTSAPELYSDPDMAFRWNSAMTPVRTGLAFSQFESVGFILPVKADLNQHRTIQIWVGGFDAEAKFSIFDPDYSSGGVGGLLDHYLSFPGEKVNYRITITSRRATTFGVPEAHLYWRLQRKYSSASKVFIMAAAVK